MSKFKNVYFPHEESSVYDNMYDLFYCALDNDETIEACFDAFMAGFERGKKFQLEQNNGYGGIFNG